MPHETRVPLVTFTPSELTTQRPIEHPYGNDDDSDDGLTKRKRWWDYAPLCRTCFLCFFSTRRLTPRLVTVVFLLAPHPSLLHIFINYHYLTLNSIHLLLTHIAVTHGLTFLALCSLIVCAVRDPGPVPLPTTSNDPEGDISLTDALVGPPDDDYLKPGRWCRICWAPKPERTHHCSACGRCVLKMGAPCIPK